MDWSQSLRIVAPEEFLSLTGIVLLLASAWSRGNADARWVNRLAVLALAIAALMVAPVLSSGVKGASAQAFGGLFVGDAFAAFAKLLIYVAAGASLLVSPAFFEKFRASRPEYPVLVLFAVSGMGIMVSAGNLMSLYIGLELNSLAAYVLAAFLKNDDRSAEAGLKYFVLGALASGIMLFGMSLVYGFTGTTSFAGINAAMQGQLGMGALFGLTFVLTGLAFKISAVPFHMWTPDVYEGAPTPVTAFFASAPKVAALALTMRVRLQIDSIPAMDCGISRDLRGVLHKIAASSFLRAASLLEEGRLSWRLPTQINRLAAPPLRASARKQQSPVPGVAGLPGPRLAALGLPFFRDVLRHARVCPLAAHLRAPGSRKAALRRLLADGAARGLPLAPKHAPVPDSAGQHILC